MEPSFKYEEISETTVPIEPTGTQRIVKSRSSTASFKLSWTSIPKFFYYLTNGLQIIIANNINIIIIQDQLLAIEDAIRPRPMRDIFLS